MFEIGREYNRRSEIHAIYGGQRQGGISTPSKFPMIFLFTGESGNEYGYKDEYKENGIFWYTGEGQVGDMKMTKGNRAIKDHVRNNKIIYLFEYVSQGNVKYLGEAYYLSYHIEPRPDVNNNFRKAFIFELEVTTSKDIEIEGSNNVKKQTSKSLWKKSQNELKEISRSRAATGTDTKTRKTIIYQRSEAVKIYALKRANGQCECCDNPAPFISQDNRPFLEVHHIRRRADGGPDDPRWVAAICPNCHREAHYGKNQKEIFDRLNKFLEKIET